MTRRIEYNGHSVCVSMPAKTAYSQAEAIPKGEMITVCAWCDCSKAVTKILTDYGYKISHGMCEQCNQQQMKGMTDECKTNAEPSSGRDE